MIRANEKEIHIRMGKELNFVRGIILTDGTVLQNMQYDLNANIPTDEALRQFEMTQLNHVEEVSI